MTTVKQIIGTVLYPLSWYALKYKPDTSCSDRAKVLESWRKRGKQQ